MWARLSRRRRKVFVITGGTLISLIVVFFIFINSFLEPIIRDRLHTLIVQGSDSLYTYTLGSLETSFVSSSVVVENLQVRIDSNRYRQLVARNALPVITFELNLVRGSIDGVAIFPLLFGKRVSMDRIRTLDASIALYRHLLPGSALEKDPPLWKTIRPSIKSIRVRTLQLDNLKFGYRNTDTAHLVRFRFERCFARLDDFRVDSASYTDTSRLIYAKDLAFDFRRLDFVTADTLYHLKAGNIKYSSAKESLEVSDLLLKPTLDPPAFYARTGYQENRNSISLERLEVTGFPLHQFLNNDRAVAQAVILHQPRFDIYLDKTLPPHPDSKIGKSPPIWLRNAGFNITINTAQFRNASLTYTEKNEKTLREGQVRLDDLDLRFTNITNDTVRMRKQPKCVVEGTGTLLGSTPFQANFTFYLGSADGRFEATGRIGAVNAEQLNTVAEPLAGAQLRSFNMQYLRFAMAGDQLTTIGHVSMPYDHLQVVFQKTDGSSGIVSTKKLVTKVLNKYVIHDRNPEPGGPERKAAGVKRTRTSAQSFAALIWQSIFAGMQEIMLKKD